MRLIRSALWCAMSHQFQSPHAVRAFSASPFPYSDEWDKLNSPESFGESEQYNKLNSPESFGESEQHNSGDVNSSMASFYRKLEKAEKAHGDRSGMGWGLGDNSNSLIDGMDSKLKKAAAYFEFDPIEVARDDYSFRPDVNFQSGMSYDTKDLDLRKPGVRKPNRRVEFATTTAEVLREADFRNVKFLAKFLTEAGIIKKRSMTGISAKAQRKVAREIKTARAFGLMPFTTMGTKEFRYGDSMEDMERDFEFESSYEHNFVEEDA